MKMDTEAVLRQLKRLAQAGIVADAPDAAVQVVVREAEAAEETEGEVGDLAELETGDAVERAEEQGGGDVRAETPAQHRLARVAVAIVKPDQRVILQVVHDGHGGHGGLPAHVGEGQPVQRDDGGEEQVLGKIDAEAAAPGAPARRRRWRRRSTQKTGSHCGKASLMPSSSGW